MNSYNFINETQNDKINSTLIKVEALQKEYEVTLQQYQEAGKNYITTLQTEKSNNCGNYKKDSTDISQECNIVSTSTKNTTNKLSVYPNIKTSIFTALKGRTWWGTTGLSEGSVSSQEECENMCANSTQCSGATFNPVKRYCWTRTGDSTITAGRDDDYALITQQKAALSVMKVLNERLLTLNHQIIDELKNINPEVRQQYEEKNKKQELLSSSYNQLLEQKIEMDKQLQEYYSIDKEEENQSLYVNQQNMSYRFLLLIVTLIILITIKQLFGTENPPFSMTIWLLIIIVLIILTYSLSTRSGFMMLFMLLVTIALMKSGNLPSP